MCDKKINQFLWLTLTFLSGAAGLGLVFLAKNFFYGWLENINLYIAWGGLALVGSLISLPIENRLIWLRKANNLSYVDAIGSGSTPPLSFGFFIGLAIGLGGIVEWG